MNDRMRVALAGNPNVGKTSLFNVLTGSRYKVGNFAGVTVESREGQVSPRYARGRDITLVDLPGIYSLTATSEDEAIASAMLSGRERQQPDAVLLVLDATNLARNLYLALQTVELGLPTVVALNMSDIAKRFGMSVDTEVLARELGVNVVETVARTGVGAQALVDAFGNTPARLGNGFAGVSTLARVLTTFERTMTSARARWLVLTAAAARADSELPHYALLSPPERAAISEIAAPDLFDAARELITARYHEVDRLLAAIRPREPTRDGAPTMAYSRRIDGVLTHRVFGLAIFVVVMTVIFQAIFTWAEPLMGAIESIMAWLAAHVAELLGPGLLTDLLTQGVIHGAGNVLVFVPQIALLFLFIGLLEDCGYLARAAFLMDRLMARVGLHGKAFVPLLSGYACAVPAILSTRTISSMRDRMVTILMIPFMSCSARLPVYALVIAALFEPSEGGVVLTSMYALSTVSALAMGFVYKRTLLRGPTPPLMLELPPYRLPKLSNTLANVSDRTMDFVKGAGGMILACTIVLWALLSFPRPTIAEDSSTLENPQARATTIEQSYGGRFARALEPVLEPIGQDWRMGIGLVGSFAAREVFVSTLGLVHGIENSDDQATPLRDAIRNARDPETGAPRYTKLKGLALMVFFVYACQCMSTLAVVQRETRSWRWPVFMFVSMTAIAYAMALLVYEGGRWLGFA